MEKLDEILQAEESARRTVSDARERARDIRKEAMTEAELIKSSAARESADKSITLRKKILKDADAQAAVIERDAEAELGELLDVARGRFDEAAGLVVDELVG